MARFEIIPGRGRVRVDNSFLGGHVYCGGSSSGSSGSSNAQKPISSYERTKAQVYATGNKWAIENFHATHD